MTGTDSGGNNRFGSPAFRSVFLVSSYLGEVGFLGAFDGLLRRRSCGLTHHASRQSCWIKDELLYQQRPLSIPTIGDERPAVSHAGVEARGPHVIAGNPQAVPLSRSLAKTLQPARLTLQLS